MLQPKISVIMQAYLGDYPGSRSNSIDKFIRAITTFKAQTYSNSELIIVSDGCNIVHETYNSQFKLDPQIKYAFVDKKGIPNMYELVDGQKYYRGIPRQVGVTLADGDLITYMDSDDFLLPNFLESIVSEFNKLDLQEQAKYKELVKRFGLNYHSLIYKNLGETWDSLFDNSTNLPVVVSSQLNNLTIKIKGKYNESISKYCNPCIWNGPVIVNYN
jgi:glycosyltransferase involved in cell wall biosynthesis